MIEDFTFHPNATAAINSKAVELLGLVEKLDMTRKDSPSSFESQRPSSTLNADQIIGEFKGWGRDAQNNYVYFCIQEDEGIYGFSDENHRKLKAILSIILKQKWVQNYISINFIEQTIIEWIRLSWRNASSGTLSDHFTKQAPLSVKEFTMWAPISNFEIEKDFIFGPVTISSMTKDFFDDIETPSVANTPEQSHEISKLFDRLRSEMQGLAAVVFRSNAEAGYILEKGMAIASDAIGLLRFFSPSATQFGVMCPNSLLGAQEVPYFNVIVLGKEGSFSNSSGVIPEHIGYWRLSAATEQSLRSKGLDTLSRLASPDKLTEFQARLRASILTFTKGITFSESADRLVYTCSALESFLLRDMSEPIQQNLGERMAFLLTQNPAERTNIVSTVRQAYSVRSRYIHHRQAELEDFSLYAFTVYAHQVFDTALRNIDSVTTPSQFIDAIDRIKFGG